MAEKTGNKAGNTIQDNWFDLIPEEDRDELKAKQWQTEYRTTDDESAIGNLHYGTETERDSLRESTRQPDMQYVQPDLDLPQDNTPATDTTPHRPEPADQAMEDIPRQASSFHQPSLSAEALSSGDTSPLTIHTPDIARVDSQEGAPTEPEAPAAIPEVIRTGTKTTAASGTIEAKVRPTEPAEVPNNESSPNHRPTVQQQSEDPEQRNNAPDAVNDVGITEESTAITLDVLANDSDRDGDSLHISAVSVQEQLGTVTVNDGTTITFTPGTDFDHLAEGETRDVQISYTISDGHGGTDDATATVTVTGTNDGPVALDDSATTAENAAIEINVLANDSDIDTSDALTVTHASTADGQGDVTINNDGTLLFTPGTDFDHLAAGETQNVEIAYTIDDGHGGTDSATATVTVTGTNDGPVALDDSATTAENAAIEINVLANDSDIDTSDVLTVTHASTADGQGDVTINDDGTLLFTPGADFDHLTAGETQNVEIAYTIDDGHGGTDDATATVTVTGTNDAPVITETTPVTVTEDSMDGFTGYGQAWEGDVYSIVTQEEMLAHLGISDPDSSSFTVSLADASPAWHGGIQANDSAFISDTLQAGSNQYDETVIQVTQEFLDNYPNVDAKVGDFYFDHVDFDKLSEGEIAKVNFSVQVSDGETTSDPKEFNITVTGSNDTPTVTGTVELSGSEDTSFSFTAADLLTNAEDIDSHDTLSVANVSIDPDQGTLSSNTDGTFTFTPKENFNGAVTINYEVSDGTEIVPASASLDVAAVNDNPIAVDDHPAINHQAKFDGNNTSLVADSSIIEDNSKPYTVSLDITPDDQDYGYIISNGGQTHSSSGFFVTRGVYGHDSSVYQVGVADENQYVVFQGGEVENGKQSNLTFTYDGHNLTVYQDGVDITATGTINVRPGRDLPMQNVTLGAPSNIPTSYEFKGETDNIQIYDTALDNTQVSHIQNGEIPDENHLVAHYTFDGDGSYADLSGNGHDLLVHGAVEISATTDPALTTDEDSSLTINAHTLLANDTDVDGDTLAIATVSADVVDADGNVVGSAVRDDDGNIVFTPNDSLNSLAEGERKEVHFSYTISDGHGGTDTATASLNITGNNDGVGPVTDVDSGANIIAENAADGTEVHLTGLAADPEGEAVTYALVDEQGNEVTDGAFAIDSDSGIVTLQDSSKIDYETQASHTLHIKATSEDGTTSTSDFTVQVGDVEVIKTTDLGGDENGTPVTFTLTGDHYDPQNIQDVGAGSPQYRIRVNGEILEVDGRDTFTVEANRGHIVDNHVVRDGNDVELVTFKVPEGTDIDSVSIEFTNDAYDYATDRDGDGITTEDRNLVVKELNIGGTVNPDGTIDGGTVLQAEDTDVSQYIAGNGVDVSGREVMPWQGTMTFYTDGVPPEVDSSLFTEGNDRVDLARDDPDYGTEKIYSALGGNDTIISGDGNDTIDAGAGNDRIYVQKGTNVVDAGEGNDVIDARGGTNTIDAGDGNDYIYADGNDTIKGGEGYDTANYSAAETGVNIDLAQGGNAESIERVYASNHDDTIRGSDADEQIYANDGNDTIDAGAGNDRIYVQKGTNVVDAGEGNDVIDARGGTNTIDAGDGNDYIYADGNDTIKGGEGYDTANYSAAETGVNIDLAQGGNAESIERVYASNHDDTIRGSDADEQIYANDGNDTIDAGAGNDRIYGGKGDDTLAGGAGNDTIVGDEGNDTVVFSGNQDEYNIVKNTNGSFTVQDTVDGRDDNDTVSGVEQFQFADGTVAADDLTLSANLIDGAVQGVEYTTSSGLHGLTDANGGFSFKSGDDVTFTVGGVTLGMATADDVTSGQTFLQDIADVDRTDLNDEYTENMATFLQSLDKNSDAYDGIVITDEIREALADVHIDLRTASEEDVRQLVEQVGKEYVSEDAAMEHVEDMLVAKTGLSHDDFQEHIDDGPNTIAEDRQHTVIASLPDENSSIIEADVHDFSTMEIRVPSVDLDVNPDTTPVDTESSHIMAGQQPDPADGNGEEGMPQAHMETDNTVAQQPNHATGDAHNLFSIGELHADQLPSSIMADQEKEQSDGTIDHSSGQETGTGNQVVAGHNEHNADNTHAVQGEHAQAATQNIASSHDTVTHDQSLADHSSHGGDEVKSHVLHDTATDSSNSPAPEHDSAGTVAGIDDHNLHVDAGHEDDIASVGQLPEISLAGEEHNSTTTAAQTETVQPHSLESIHSTTEGMEGGHNDAQLDQFAVSDGAHAGADSSLDHFAVTDNTGDADGDASLNHFVVSDANPAMDEIPPMDGLDATPDQQPLPEPEAADAGIGVHDAVIPDDVQDPGPLHQDIIPA